MSQTRQKLVAAAAAEMERVSFHGTDTNGIARAAGFAPATFYKHFDDKLDVFLVAHETWVDAEWAALDVIGEDATKIVDFVIEHHRRHKGLRASLRALVATNERVREFHRSERRRQLAKIGGGPDAAILFLEVERVADAIADGELAALGVSEAAARAHLVARVGAFLR